MVLSDEPGYYEDGNFGIRIESSWSLSPLAVPPLTPCVYLDVVMVKEAKTNHQFGDKP